MLGRTLTLPSLRLRKANITRTKRRNRHISVIMLHIFSCLFFLSVNFLDAFLENLAVFLHSFHKCFFFFFLDLSPPSGLFGTALDLMLLNRELICPGCNAPALPWKRLRCLWDVGRADLRALICVLCLSAESWSFLSKAAKGLLGNCHSGNQAWWRYWLFWLADLFGEELKLPAPC